MLFVANFKNILFLCYPTLAFFFANIRSLFMTIFTRSLADLLVAFKMCHGFDSI